MESLLKAIRQIENAVGVKPGFFVRLLKEDDWSFVIKLHALIEAAVTHLLVVAAGDERLTDLYARLDLSDTTKGKLAFVKDLNLLQKSNRRVIKTLSELRNSLVHDIRNVGITLDEFIGRLDKQQSKNLIESLCQGEDLPIEINGKEIPIRQFYRENLRVGLWMASMGLLGDIYLSKEQMKLRGDYAKRMAKFGQFLLEKFPRNPPEHQNQ